MSSPPPDTAPNPPVRTHRSSAAEERPEPPFDFSGLCARWRRERRQARAASARLRALVRTRAGPVLERFHAERAFLFGSLIEDRAHADSDVDLLVLGTDPGTYWELRLALETALGRRVDLHTERDDARFVAKVLGRGELIHGRAD
jgi:predicted nucleotidyltransferase